MQRLSPSESICASRTLHRNVGITVNQPNVLWISTHDINPHLGTYRGIWPGAEDAITPNLDKLAAEGQRFDQAFTAAPVCGPSRSAIISGRYPTSIGTMHMRSNTVPPPEVALLPELFRRAGYYTTNNAFTDFQMDVPPTTFDDLTPSAHWRNRPAGTPFFSTFHGFATHESMIYLPEKSFEHVVKDVPKADRHDPASVNVPPYYPDSEVFRTSWARYLDLITQMDHWVGDLLAQLEEDGLAESTIVVFWSDHGAGFPGAKRWASEAGVRVPLIVRWPGVLHPGQAHRPPVALMDLAPTMLEMCGLPIPADMDGGAFITRDGLVESPSRYVVSSRDRMDEQRDTSRSIRDERYRYTRHLHPDRSPMQHNAFGDNTASWSELRRLVKREAEQLAAGVVPSLLTPLQRSIVAPTKPIEELYDLIVDPHEEVNVAEDAQHTDALVRLRAALDAWHDDFGDLGVLDEEDLVEEWRPGGHRQVTGPVEVSTDQAGRLVAECSTPGSRIGWTFDPPRAATTYTLYPGTDVELDTRSWQIYTGPIDVARNVYLKAWRIGFIPSAEVEYVA